MGRVVVVAAVAVAWGACGGSGVHPVPVPTDGGLVYPGSYEDPFVRLQRLSGSTFVEIQEVRARADGRLFFCTAVRGLQVVDASAPDHMATVAELSSSLGSAQYPRCQHVALDGDLVYITNRGDEIQRTPFVTAFDLAQDPPREVASFQQAGSSFEGVAASGGRVYVAMHDDGLAVLERTGDTLTLRGVAVGLTNAWGVAAVGSTVYVADGKDGLAIVDASDPSAPNIIGRAATGGAAQAVEVVGVTAYVAAGAAGLVIVDVTDPVAPYVVGRASTPGSALQVAVGNGRAYLADWTDVRVFDVSDRAVPRLVATERIDTGSAFPRVLGIGARDDVAFIGEWTGLYAYRFFPGRVAPDVGLSERAIEFGNVVPGGADAFALILENEGLAPLVAWQIATEGARFTVDKKQLVLAPRAAAAIEVTYRPTGDGPDEGTLVIRSDDPDEPARRVPIAGNRPGVSVGDAAPEVQVALLSGGDWRLSEQGGHVVVLAYFATF